MQRKLPTAAILVLAGAIGCDGSDQSYVSYSKFGAADDASLQGNWHISEIVVNSEAEWNEQWQMRVAILDCNLQHNAAACAASSPPAVDFSKNTVIGLTYGYRIGPLKHPLRVRESDDHKSLVVEYAYFVSGTLFYNPFPPSAEFIIVPRANAVATFEYSE